MNMNNNEIESRIKAAVSSTTPDKLDDIMAACGLESGMDNLVEVNLDSESRSSIQGTQGSSSLRGGTTPSNTTSIPENRISQQPPRGTTPSNTAANSRTPIRKQPLYKHLTAMAAALVLFVAGGLIYANQGASDVAAIIGLDVNPSIQISVDDSGKVLEASAVNEDGSSILDGMDLSGCDMKIAANAIVGSMLSLIHI